MSNVNDEWKALHGDAAMSGLTDEQAEAAASDADVTLVLAGAGTGKTKVITARAAHLVRHKGVPPEKILVLAFNRDAAQEIRIRLPADLRSIDVLTFHAFGHKVVSAGRSEAPTVSPVASDPYRFTQAIEGIIGSLVNDAEVGNLTIRLMANMPADYKAPFDFKNEWGYRRYIRGVELRALSGDLVKSFEELEIANWLIQNGVPFRYEHPYPLKTATKEKRQYQPDFYLPIHDLYIEHFALDKAGKAPGGWDDYQESVQWKRQMHRANGTALIETYSWQHHDGSLLMHLKERLLEAGVSFSPIPREHLIAKLGKERISPLCSLLSTFLNHAKSEELPHEELLKRARSASDLKRAEAFLEVFRRARELYEDLLAKERALDFHDLINEATRYLRSSIVPSSYSHVLVDEFQDISIGRMNLLKALNRPGLSYFLVGDDWQSIYRFTGSRVSLVRKVAEHLGVTQTKTLTQTFRFGPKILKSSSDFILKNPEQTRRTLRPNETVLDRGITIVATREPANAMRSVVEDIEQAENYHEGDTLLVLGRFNDSRGALKLLGSEMANKIDYRTIHSAKGQESDYVAILNLRDSRRGFPCRVEDDPLIRLVMPPIENGEYQFAEERRLFYVAMTRARKGVYLVTDERRPSCFVKEIVEDYGEEIRQIGQLPPECPSCLDGTLMESKSGKNLRCSNHPECRYLSPLCPNCMTGFVSIAHQGNAECSNPDCHAAIKVCPKCRQGILLQRLRRRDQRPFYGCSRFTEEPACRYISAT